MPKKAAQARQMDTSGNFNITNANESFQIDMNSAQKDKSFSKIVCSCHLCFSYTGATEGVEKATRRGREFTDPKALPGTHEIRKVHESDEKQILFSCWFLHEARACFAQIIGSVKSKFYHPYSFLQDLHRGLSSTLSDIENRCLEKDNKRWINGPTDKHREYVQAVFDGFEHASNEDLHSAYTRICSEQIAGVTDYLRAFKELQWIQHHSNNSRGNSNSQNNSGQYVLFDDILQKLEAVQALLRNQRPVCVLPQIPNENHTPVHQQAGSQMSANTQDPSTYAYSLTKDRNCTAPGSYIQPSLDNQETAAHNSVQFGARTSHGEQAQGACTYALNGALAAQNAANVDGFEQPLQACGYPATPCTYSDSVVHYSLSEDRSVSATSYEHSLQQLCAGRLHQNVAAQNAPSYYGSVQFDPPGN